MVFVMNSVRLDIISYLLLVFAASPSWQTYYVLRYPPIYLNDYLGEGTHLKKDLLQNTALSNLQNSALSKLKTALLKSYTQNRGPFGRYLQNAAPLNSAWKRIDIAKNYLPIASNLDKYSQNSALSNIYLQNAAVPKKYSQIANPVNTYLSNTFSNKYSKNAGPLNFQQNTAFPKMHLQKSEPWHLKPQNQYDGNSLSDSQLLEKLVNIIINGQDNKIESERDNCLRIFGSMHGTKDEKIRCLENLKKGRLAKYKLDAHRNRHQYRPVHPGLKQPFVDYTRIAEDYLGLDRVQRSDFSTDYVDFNDLRTVPDDSGNSLKLYKREYQPLIMNLPSLYNSRRMKKKIKPKALSSSDEEEESEFDSKEPKPRFSLKPKRFKVIENVVAADKDSSDSFSEEKKPSKVKKVVKKPAPLYFSEEEKPKHKSKAKPKHKHKKQVSSSSSMENFKPQKSDESMSELSSESTPPPKKVKPTKKKKQKQKKKVEKVYKKDSSSSSEEYTKPIPTKNVKNNEAYLQGNRIVTLDGRKRLQHFLPKRFHWNDHDIQHLGYFWFDGAQGRYGNFRIRP